MYHNFAPFKMYRNTMYKWGLRITKMSPGEVYNIFDVRRTQKKIHDAIDPLSSTTVPDTSVQKTI